MDGNIFNSQGVRVAIVLGPAIFDLKGKKLYDLRGIDIYKLSGALVGHLANAQGADKHLDKATDRLFPLLICRFDNSPPSGKQRRIAFPDSAKSAHIDVALGPSKKMLDSLLDAQSRCSRGEKSIRSTNAF